MVETHIHAWGRRVYARPEERQQPHTEKRRQPPHADNGSEPTTDIPAILLQRVGRNRELPARAHQDRLSREVRVS